MSVIRRILTYCNTTNVRWLSRGPTIERFWQVKEEVSSLLDNLDTQEATKHFEFLAKERNMLAVAFLKDTETFKSAHYRATMKWEISI